MIYTRPFIETTVWVQCLHMGAIMRGDFAKELFITCPCVNDKEYYADIKSEIHFHTYKFRGMSAIIGDGGTHVIFLVLF